MRKCLQCLTPYRTEQSGCTQCGFTPAQKEGFVSYAPDSLPAEGGFNPSAYALLAEKEAENFWFKARNDAIIWLLKKYAPQFQSFLEIGCGTGFVLSGIKKAFPHSSLHGSELFIEGLEFAQKRLPGVPLMQMDARAVPFVEEFDAIGAFDVLEHIEEDEQVLSQIHTALKPSGIFFLTVPQHPWLWSNTDIQACHVRRYTQSDLVSKLERANFEICYSNSFVSILLPLMLLSRMRQKEETIPQDPVDELALPPILNALLYCTLQAELALTKLGMPWPCGGSRIIAARKCG